ncbi:hypothetical protein QAD02_003149 [Eretmocerus hayati]|uniref:Uncharacterized protein n=1 Tax=Eretmocerus hayati TaxID=131215 RepID=A0ACC2NKW7_9HYME|nr:hypothetical protein QAD02_003149 [Eretmocerus hayati]
MGSTNGTISLYDLSTSTISDQLFNGHSSSVTAVSRSSMAGSFTAAEDKQIVQWDHQEKACLILEQGSERYVKNQVRDDAEYITAGTEESTAMEKSSKSRKAALLLSKLRLENWSLDNDGSTSHGVTTKGQSMS